MKTPAFWSDRNIISTLLTPLGCLYALATKLNISTHTPRKVNIPVICIGNLTAGGTGKTPTAASLASLLQTDGKEPFFVSRGYGGKLRNVVVDPTRHTPQEVGDEPLILARQAPAVVSPDRHEGALTAIKNGAELIIMDDGFQNPRLHKDLSFLVFDGGFGYGNGKCIPAGPLRENLKDGLKRADAILIIGEDRHKLAQQFDLPVFNGKITPVSPAFSERTAIAFAGIGRPEKFYQSLRELNFKLLQTYDFPDHHFYTENELKQLIQTADKKQAVLITTAKDYVKIPMNLRKYFQVLEITINWQNPQELKDFIRQRIK